MYLKEERESLYIVCDTVLIYNHGSLRDVHSITTNEPFWFFPQNNRVPVAFCFVSERGENGPNFVTQFILFLEHRGGCYINEGVSKNAIKTNHTTLAYRASVSVLLTAPFGHISPLLGSTFVRKGLQEF
jgi:hypothetical protein